MISDEAISVACEHVRYCRSIGMSPPQVVAMYAPKGWKQMFLIASRWSSISWDDATWAVAAAFQELPREIPERLAA